MKFQDIECKLKVEAIPNSSNKSFSLQVNGKLKIRLSKIKIAIRNNIIKP